MKVRKEIQKKLELTGGYVDPNMRTYEITEAKVIIDLCGKFQFTKPQLVPMFKQNQDEEYLRNLNFANLYADVMKEQAILEKGVRDAKIKKLKKWKLSTLNMRKKKAINDS